MQKSYEEFTKRDAVVIAVSQEDKDLESAGKFLKRFGKAGPPFDVLIDVQREKTGQLDRTTTYLIDKQGIVREIFPALISKRPNWSAVLHKLDEINE